jgi:hypothetical protein
LKLELQDAGLLVKFELQDAELPVKGPQMVDPTTSFDQNPASEPLIAKTEWQLYVTRSVTSSKLKSVFQIRTDLPHPGSHWRYTVRNRIQIPDAKKLAKIKQIFILH